MRNGQRSVKITEGLFRYRTCIFTVHLSAPASAQHNLKSTRASQAPILLRAVQYVTVQLKEDPQDGSGVRGTLPGRVPCTFRPRMATQCQSNMLRLRHPVPHIRFCTPTDTAGTAAWYLRKEKRSFRPGCPSTVQLLAPQLLSGEARGNRCDWVIRRFSGSVRAYMHYLIKHCKG